MVYGLPYTDESWVTEDVFPAPTPLVVSQWVADSEGMSFPPLTLHGEPVFAFLIQRRAGGGRVVPSVLDRNGDVRAVEPGKSWKHFTLVVPPPEGNFAHEDDVDYRHWQKTRSRFDPDKLAEATDNR